MLWDLLMKFTASAQSHLICITYWDPSSTSIPNAWENWRKEEQPNFLSSLTNSWCLWKTGTFCKLNHLSLNIRLCKSVRQLKWLTLGQTQLTGVPLELSLTHWLCSAVLSVLLPASYLSHLWHGCWNIHWDIHSLIQNSIREPKSFLETTQAINGTGSRAVGLSAPLSLFPLTADLIVRLCLWHSCPGALFSWASVHCGDSTNSEEGRRRGGRCRARSSLHILQVTLSFIGILKRMSGTRVEDFFFSNFCFAAIPLQDFYHICDARRGRQCSVTELAIHKISGDLLSHPLEEMMKISIKFLF